MRRGSQAGAALALVLWACVGCTFHRTVVNGYQADLSSAWIKPGRTTFDEVVGRLGLPPHAQGMKGYTGDALHYRSSDAFTTRFELGYIVTPTFERSHKTVGDDLLVVFDERKVVKFVSRTRTRQTPVSGEQTTEVLDLRGVL